MWKCDEILMRLIMSDVNRYLQFNLSKLTIENNFRSKKRSRTREGELAGSNCTYLFKKKRKSKILKFFLLHFPKILKNNYSENLKQQSCVLHFPENLKKQNYFFIFRKIWKSRTIFSFSGKSRKTENIALKQKTILFNKQVLNAELQTKLIFLTVWTIFPN